MAVDPTIALQVKPSNIPLAYQQGVAARQQQQQNALLNQQRQQQLQQGQQTLQQNEYTMALAKSKDALRYVTSPEQYVAWMQSSFQDPVLGPALQRMGVTLEKAMANVQQQISQPGGLQRLRQQSAASIDQLSNLAGQQAQQQQRQAAGTDVNKLLGLGTSEATAAANALLRQQELGKPAADPEKVRQYLFAQTPAGGGYKGTFEDFLGISKAETEVNVGQAEGEYQKYVGKKKAEKDTETYANVEAAAGNIAKLDETLYVLENQDINTGIGAEVLTVLDRARTKLLADKEAGKRVTNTEYLDALLGSDVFPQIGALGIGARGLDTPAEREFLRKVMTGTISLNKDTLVRMTELRRKGIEAAVAKFNKEIDEGKWGRFFSAQGIEDAKSQKIQLPERQAKTPVEAPEGVDPDVWHYMTPEEKALWAK